MEEDLFNNFTLSTSKYMPTLSISRSSKIAKVNLQKCVFHDESGVMVKDSYGTRMSCISIMVIKLQGVRSSIRDAKIPSWNQVGCC